MINLCKIFSHIPAPLKRFDDFKHKPWIVTNEVNTKETLRKVANQPPKGNLIVAVSCFFGLNVASVRRNLEYVILVDRGMLVNEFLNETAKIVTETSCREKAIENISSHIVQKNGSYFQDQPNAAERKVGLLREEIVEGTSWLSTDESYHHIRNLFLLERVAIKRLDLCDPEAMKLLAAAIKTHQLSVDTFYLSNVHEYASLEGQESQLYEGVGSLISPSSYIINSHVTPSLLLMQRLVQKGERSVQHCLRPQ